MNIKESDIKMQNAFEIKQAILNYNSKKSQVDDKYIEYQKQNLQFNIDYVQFLKNVKELLDERSC